MSATSIPVYVINLDRSPDRLAEVTASAASYGITVSRIAAVDGRSVVAAEHPDVDVARFERVNGRKMMPGELGCYFSHVKALQTLLASGCEVALICEDDVIFTDETFPVLRRLADRADWDVVKLYSTRYRGFVMHARLGDGWVMGRCLHGPSGCSAAYAVTRAGARRLLDNLLPMILPFDVALERGWKGDIRYFTTDKRAIRLHPHQPSTIVASGNRIRKYAFYRRGGTLAFRAAEYVRRMAFAMRGAAVGRSR